MGLLIPIFFMIGAFLGILIMCLLFNASKCPDPYLLMEVPSSHLHEDERRTIPNRWKAALITPAILLVIAIYLMRDYAAG